jgi:hypothetical protein
MKLLGTGTIGMGCCRVAARAPQRAPALGPRMLPMLELDPRGAPKAPPPGGVSNASLLLEKGRFRALPDVPGAAVTTHLRNNNRGQTVGLYVEQLVDGTPPQRGFLMQKNGEVTRIDVPGALVTLPLGVNDRGQIVGVYLDARPKLVSFLYERGRYTRTGAAPASADPPPAAAGTTSHGLLIDHGVVTPIDHPDAATVPRTPDGQTGTGTLGVNDRGEVLGIYEGRDRIVRHFVRDRKGRFAIIDDPPGTRGDMLSYEAVDINNRGEIVGFYNDEQGATTTGFLRTRKGRLTDIAVPGSRVTGPLRINDRRQVVGLYVDAEGAVHGFLRDGGAFATIDVPGATTTAVLGINNRGQMVGSYIDRDGAYHGFLLDRGAFRLLDGTRDATYTRALDVSNRGQIVGDYGTRPPVGDSSANARRLDLGRGLRPGVRGGRTWLP